MSLGKTTAHINEIAAMLISQYHSHTQKNEEDLARQVSSVLAKDVKKRPASSANFARVKNNRGGFKSGIYRLKRKKEIKPTPTPVPVVTSQYTGAAGENAVISELLFYGYNASRTMVDDGIDVIASKDGQYFHIQVKTSNKNADTFTFTVSQSSLNAKAEFRTFYIFVMRDNDGLRYFNDYLIFPSNELEKYKDSNVIKGKGSLSIRIQKDERGRYVLNNNQEVTISVNTFAQLK